MAVMLGIDQLEGVLSMGDAIDLLEQTSRHEAAGRTFIAPRFNADFDRGAMRFLFGADYERGYAVTKAYHIIEGAGVRYIVTLYRLDDGEALALIDGQIITDLRTGAASGVLARRVPVAGPIHLGVIGSGNQARAQVESLACVYPLTSVSVFSPTRENRERFAREMSAKLAVPVRAVESAEAAVRGHDIVATASGSRSADPVLRGKWLDRCRLLCAVGNTREHASEIDQRCFSDARLVVVDSPVAIEEAGDLIHAEKSGCLPHEKRATLAQVVSGETAIPREGLIVFKSVGSALQDLSLATRYYELLGTNGGLASEPSLAVLRKTVAIRATG